MNDGAIHARAKKGRGCWVAVGLGLLIFAGWLVLMWPRLRGARIVARRSATQNHALSIGKAVLSFDSNDWRLPGLADRRSQDPTPPVAWLTLCLPQLERERLHGRYDIEEPFDSAANAEVAGTVVKEFLTMEGALQGRSTDGRYALAHFAGNDQVLGPDGVLSLNGMSDGVANTLLLGTVGGFPAAWADPENHRDPSLGLGSDRRRFGTPQLGGVGTFVMSDGSVQIFTDHIDPAVFAALGTPDGGEPLASDAW